jgi:4-hydroxy-3-methylbut-2-enyl diphosphate reductase
MNCRQGAGPARATIRASREDYTFLCAEALPCWHGSGDIEHEDQRLAASTSSIATETQITDSLDHEMSNRVKRVVVAKELGYCWGVRRALEIIEAAAETAGPIAPIGDVIHNPQVVERLRERGVAGAASVDQAAQGGFRRVAITAHGMGPHLAGEAASAGLELIDTTCPLVTKVQRLAQKLVRQGYYLVVYGDAYHPEVRGVIGWAGTTKAVAAKKISDLPWNAPRGATGEGLSTPPRKVAVVSQTTKNVDELMAFAQTLQAMVMPEGGEFRLCNTICEPTSERQNALKRLVEKDHVDLILAIGGRKSSNTARLAEIGQVLGVSSYHIERPEEIEDAWLANARVVGVTAGASTPDDVIEAVVAELAERGYAPPEGGIRPVDDGYVPAY